MHAHDAEQFCWYEVDHEARSVSVSNILVKNQLNNTVLGHILGQLERIHQCSPSEDEIDIYANYVPKLTQRYTNYNYQVYPDSEKIFNYLCTAFDDYQSLDLGIRSVIHGDPVLTNILCADHQEIKFIDMRGHIGEKLTIVGDRNYDYAKIYQSLLGYDHILAGKDYGGTNLAQLRECFFKLVGEENREWITIISMSLLFSLIPLHDNEKCHQYYNILHSMWRQNIGDKVVWENVL
jgi:hypothetical protein